jgi:DNA mismatch endonuclease (patch repair protein)
MRPKASSENARKTMQANRSESTLEIRLRRRIWGFGQRGYRIHYPVTGRPDLAFPRARVAVFVNGCFWHRCPRCALKSPKANASFWRDKFRGTAERDRRARVTLESQGWRVVVVWECDIRSDTARVAKIVTRSVATALKARVASIDKAWAARHADASLRTSRFKIER